jgi:hypothetical protein
MCTFVKSYMGRRSGTEVPGCKTLSEIVYCCLNVATAQSVHWLLVQGLVL